VGEEQVVGEFSAEGAAPRLDTSWQRHAGERPEGLPPRPVEDEGNQAGSRLDDTMAEAAREDVAPVGRTDLRDREAAGGDDKARRLDRPARGVELEAGAADADRLDTARLPALHGADVALGEQHGDDLVAPAVAEQLPLVLLVPRDAVSLDEIDEIARRVARERRAAEVAVPGIEVARADLDVGEVAAAAARDADLLGDLVGMVEQHDRAAELPGDRRAVQAGGAGADDGDVEAHEGARRRRQPFQTKGKASCLKKPFGT
jgi:hypothetical protein